VGKVSISKKRTHTLMVSLLTLQRRAELALAEWKEFDFVAKEWHVPAKHDKMRRGHTVPLTNWTVAELMALKALCGTSRFVLPNRKGDRPSSPQLISRSVMRLQKRFQEIGIAPFTPHDLRRTGRTEMGRLGVLTNIAERVLNHSKEVIEGTYDLYDYLPEKRDALEKWERRLLQLQSIAPATQQPAQLSKKTPRRRGRMTGTPSPGVPRPNHSSGMASTCIAS
jgi:integrase